MITKELFIETIEAIEKQYKKDIEISKHLGRAFPNAFTANLLPDNELVTNALLKLLKNQFKDDSDWIQYFIYELDFGQENWRLKAYDGDHNEIPLKTAEDLYNLLRGKDE